MNGDGLGNWWAEIARSLRWPGPSALTRGSATSAVCPHAYSKRTETTDSVIVIAAYLQIPTHTSLEGSTNSTSPSTPFLPQRSDRSLVLLTESRTGAVADRSGAVHAFGCRRCGPETVPRFQPPLINPCTTFSITRLSEVLHRVAVGAALFHLTVPDRVYTPNFWKYAAS